ncbi:peptidylprolyl isomerase [Ponticaulis profundi]|uniref:Parvulin-like PPIase n=1 Tax=Ponticaulis profundi TaxID=2665222 RepID=A0ABW1SEY1_9PROT
MIGIRASLIAIAAATCSGSAIAQDLALGPQAEAAVAEDPQARLLGGVAAVVNDEVISISDVAQRARLLLITLGVPANQENLQQALPRALEELIEERLQLQKAAEYELEISDEAIESAVADIASSNQSTVQQLYDTLRQSGVNPTTLQDQMRAEIAWQRIMGGLYGQRIRISRGQIDNMLNRLSQSATEERYQLAEIFLYAPTEADKQQILEGAGVIIEQLGQGARFQLAAQQYSNAPSAAVGGDLGWVSPAELEPEAREVIENTTPPALTPPILVEDGVYIYAVRGKQDGADEAFEVSLRQILSTGSGAALNALALEQPGCDQLESIANADDGLVYADLGVVPENALTAEVRAAIDGVPVGRASSVLNTPNGEAVLFVCDRQAAGLQLPSRSQIEDRLYNQQISMLSQRDLRDLKREATIIRR